MLEKGKIDATLQSLEDTDQKKCNGVFFFSADGLTLPVVLTNVQFSERI